MWVQHKEQEDIRNGGIKMKLNVYSWNMQGYSDDKMKACLSKVCNQNNVIIFLQEMGNKPDEVERLLLSMGNKLELLTFFTDHQAANFRCSTGVIISKNLKNYIYANQQFVLKNITTKSKHNAIFGSDDVIYNNCVFAKGFGVNDTYKNERPLLYFYINGYYLSTKHMIAKSTKAIKQTRDDIEYLLSNPINRYDKVRFVENKGFIIIGDFNNPVNNCIGDINNVTCSHSGKATHNSGSILDYCYHTTNIDLDTLDNGRKVRNIDVADAKGNLLSDHRMIEIFINLY